ncbi:hypothetical protein B9Z19DRAFT_1103326 [Tuber borchii]|uniref:Carrier domain-containing protein n=1 Tax=Tuber borchii TaxID=42251 RepID=A0A2T6ZGV7_TUBBO|nr:hypothetical protein B9Z19DRAFT_1103326 [Tuber borchii]
MWVKSVGGEGCGWGVEREMWKEESGRRDVEGGVWEEGALAYQFASSVRWIETQDVILSQQAAECLVERQILCYNKDGKDIYYDVEPIEEEEEKPAEVLSTPSATAAAAGAAPPAIVPPASTGQATAVADELVQAVDILRSLIAEKLKKPLSEIPLLKAIKDLVNGKSTLENEVLGDVQKEFGNTPGEPDGTPLYELGAAMQTTFNRQLGKQSSSMIARMISSKMLGGFDITTARKYLTDRYSLQSARQDRRRKGILDNITTKYTASAGISLSGPAAETFFGSQEANKLLQAQIDLPNVEHGDFYASDIVSQCIRIMNLSNPTLVEFMQYHIDNCPAEHAPVYKGVQYPTTPQTTIDAKGNMQYSEVPQPAVLELEHYVKETATGRKLSEYGKRTKIIKQYQLSKSSQLQIETLYANIFPSLAMNEAQMRKGRVKCILFLHLKRKEENRWEYSKKLTGLYLNCLEQAAQSGVTFENKNVLMTGAGAGFIGAEVLQSHQRCFSRDVTEYYQAMYSSTCTLNLGHYDTEKNGLGWDLDYVVPFAAITQNGHENNAIDSRSELAHCIMLTNLLRLLGIVKTNKASRGFEAGPAQVILPLSPNHGNFENDGLYSESELAMEALFQRWHSEPWGSYLTICGAIIGWTRGIDLMGGNNSITEGIEKLGVRTFSQQEMAFNLLGLMTPAIVDLCQIEPIFADLNGSFQYIPNLKDVTAQLRQNLLETCEVHKGVTAETSIEHKIVNCEVSEKLYQKATIQPAPQHEIEPLAQNLRGMADLEKVVVVTGFTEVGPWGNFGTRWEMEAYGKFSLAGCIEMARIMGLIKHFKGPIKSNQYAGWPVEDKDIKLKYEKHILEHSGIRFIKSDLKELLQEVEASAEFKRYHNSGEDTVRALSGWDAKKCTIPDDIIMCVVESLFVAGITNPYEFYKYVHLSMVGNSLSSGVADRNIDRPIQKDILPESFINTMSAWVNMLLLSSTSPIKTPVGACATAVESLDIGYETIVEGKAKVCFEEGSYEYANMGATSNAEEELLHGRILQEMSGPTTTTRNGFMNSQGCEMGVPIYGIVALTTTATDRIEWNISAPRQGIFTTARETASKFPSPLLDIKKSQIKQWTESELLYLQAEIDFDQNEYMQDRAGKDFRKQDPRIAPLRGALVVWGLNIDDLGVASFHGTCTHANDKNKSDAINKMMMHLGRQKGNAVLAIQVVNLGLVPVNRKADNVDKNLEQFHYLVYPSRSIQTDGIKAFSVTSFGFGQKGAQAIGVHPKYHFATLDEQTYQTYQTKVDSHYKKTYRYYHTSLTLL